VKFPQDAMRRSVQIADSFRADAGLDLERQVLAANGFDDHRFADLINLRRPAPLLPALAAEEQALSHAAFHAPPRFRT